MARKQYWVDWSDAAFPEIKPFRDGDDEYNTVQSFGACKREIIEHFQSRINHARFMISETRRLRASDNRQERNPQ